MRQTFKADLTRISHHDKIQDHDQNFYMQFNIVIAGLDSISARRWINATLVNMVDAENEESLKPLIDGGTEGERYVVVWLTVRIQGSSSSHSAYDHLLL
jgi:molybdopterin/thiamine biosynthesis adenylyltransferase